MTTRTRLGLETLDRRELPAGLTLTGGTLIMAGSNNVEQATVWMADGLVHARMSSFPTGGGFGTTYQQSYLPGQVDEILFLGGGGNDTFGNTTYIPVFAYGDAGDDTITGGYGADDLQGGAGNDTIKGSSGGDTIRGNAGNDVLHGNSGADTVYGGDNDDHLYGGSGSDTLLGENGDDRIVSVGGGLDTQTGGSGIDSHWLDTTDTLTDSGLEDLMKRVHRIDQFEGYSYDGGVTVTAVSKELNGQDLLDPWRTDLEMELLYTKKDFASKPLFASGGPTKDDVFQGGVGDCWLLGKLSAIADADPGFIKQMVADLGDGTYAVRFYRGGVAQHIRVDADLWVNAAGHPLYAKLGQEDSIWVPIVEKAWAFFRRQEGNYASIADGQPTDKELLGATVTNFAKPGLSDPQAVIDWHNAGSPSSLVGYHVRTTAEQWLRDVKAALDAGKPVTVGAVGSVSDGTPINVNSYRRGNHVYMVDEVFTNSAGQPTGIKLRDPHGQDIDMYDMTRIYFCLRDGGYWNL